MFKFVLLSAHLSKSVATSLLPSAAAMLSFSSLKPLSFNWEAFVSANSSSLIFKKSTLYFSSDLISFFIDSFSPGIAGISTPTFKELSTEAKISLSFSLEI